MRTRPFTHSKTANPSPILRRLGEHLPESCRGHRVPPVEGAREVSGIVVAEEKRCVGDARLPVRQEALGFEIAAFVDERMEGNSQALETVLQGARCQAERSSNVD